MSDKYVFTASNIYERPFDLLSILPTTPSHLYFISTVSSKPSLTKEYLVLWWFQMVIQKKRKNKKLILTVLNDCLIHTVIYIDIQGTLKVKVNNATLQDVK